MSRVSTRTSKIFADRLSDLIKEAKDNGLQIRELAEEIGISTGSLSQYQNDSATASIDALYKIANFFGVSADFLLGMTDTRGNNGDIRKVCDSTGLYEESVAILTNLHNFPDEVPFLLTLNFLIAESKTLKCLSKYFASKFEDKLKEKPLAFIEGDSRLRDSRLFFADILAAIEQDRDEFYQKYAKDDALSEQMAFSLAQCALHNGDLEGWSQSVYNYAHKKPEDEDDDEMVKIYAKFLEFCGYGEYMKRIGVRLEDIYGTD